MKSQRKMKNEIRRFMASSIQTVIILLTLCLILLGGGFLFVEAVIRDTIWMTKIKKNVA